MRKKEDIDNSQEDNVIYVDAPEEAAENNARIQREAKRRKNLVKLAMLIFILIIGLDNIKIGFLYLFAFGCVILAIDVLIKQFFVRCIVNKKVMDLVKNNRSFE